MASCTSIGRSLKWVIGSDRSGYSKSVVVESPSSPSPDNDAIVTSNGSVRSGLGVRLSRYENGVLFGRIGGWMSAILGVSTRCGEGSELVESRYGDILALVVTNSPMCLSTLPFVSGWLRPRRSSILERISRPSTSAANSPDPLMIRVFWLLRLRFCGKM